MLADHPCIALTVSYIMLFVLTDGRLKSKEFYSDTKTDDNESEGERPLARNR
jgi:hypothetical protein